MKILKRLLVVATALIGFAAQAQSVHYQYPIETTPFVLDSAGAVIVGVHPAGTQYDGNPAFVDLFPFTINGPSLVSGIFLLPGALSQYVTDPTVPANLATPILFGIIDIPPSQWSGYSTDSSSFFSLQSVLPNAGTYAFLTIGVGGNGAGVYAALVNAVPVPEPATYGMALVGLGVVGWVARRRRIGVNAA
jgi:hypothetical protein